MALSSMELAICNKMDVDFSALTSPLNMAKSTIRTAKNRIQSSLNNMVFSPNLDVINAEIESLKSAAKDVYPSDTLEDMESLKNLIDNCSYLDDAKPISTIIGTTLGVFDQIDELIDSITIPEFSIANLGSLIDGLMSGADVGIPGGKNLTDIFKKADKLIECMSLICGAGDPAFITLASEYANTLNNLYSSLNVTSNPLDSNYGKFDFDAIYDNANMTIQEKLQVNTVLNGVGDVKTSALTSIDNSVNQAKALLKTGFF